MQGNELEVARDKTTAFAAPPNTAGASRLAAPADGPSGAADPVAPAGLGARRPLLALLVAVGVALGLLVPCAAWASEGPGGLVERPAARAAAELLADGVKAGEAAAEPKAALDDNGLPDEAAQRAAAAAAAARAASVPSGEGTARAAGSAADGAAVDEGAGASHQARRTVSVAGTAISYVDSFQSATAPSSGAGLWMGSDSTTDGSWGYFIGHNPGPFHGVMGLGQGAAVTVCDSAGNTRTYHVVDVFTVPDTTYWEDIEGRVTGHGESVILQTCVGDNASYRIVVAA